MFLRPLPHVFTALFCVALLMLSACSKHVRSHPNNAATQTQLAPVADIKTIPNLQYTPQGWPQTLQGDIYRPNNNKTYPGVLMVHGGGWSSRTRADTAGLSQRLAAQGFVVFNISHRFAPEYQFPAQIHDLQLALKWMRAQAQTHGIDANKIGGWGYSSGAHLVAMLGTISAGDELDQKHGGADTRLQAVVAGGTPADLRKYSNSDLVNNFIGARHSENYALYQQASPAFHVSADDAPFYLYHGSLDTLVKLDQPRDFKTELDAQGVPNELYVHKVRGHVTMFLNGGEAEELGAEFLQRWLNEPPPK